ncbi:uncharacterized protein An01g06580 [Aspergillus niger]|uniref:Contig An01c0240, genomic contig n=2 Tax=Aspergillus niger TaxID=5061 RepID=A2Q944_ASPNC|nr:uncharacterized protein An01g06580 [Aspergillus niger]CAK43778.1 unnamed protein product [Aspergillus niger]
MLPRSSGDTPATNHASKSADEWVGLTAIVAYLQLGPLFFSTWTGPEGAHMWVNVLYGIRTLATVSFATDQRWGNFQIVGLKLMFVSDSSFI